MTKKSKKESEPEHYRVTWTIDVFTDAGYLTAAKEAREIQADLESNALVFDVEKISPEGKVEWTESVDLAELVEEEDDEDLEEDS